MDTGSPGGLSCGAKGAWPLPPSHLKCLPQHLLLRQGEEGVSRGPGGPPSELGGGPLGAPASVSPHAINRTQILACPHSVFLGMLWGLKGQDNLADCPPTQPTCNSFGHRGRPCRLQHVDKCAIGRNSATGLQSPDQGPPPSPNTGLGPTTPTSGPVSPSAIR